MIASLLLSGITYENSDTNNKINSPFNSIKNKLNTAEKKQ